MLRLPLDRLREIGGSDLAKSNVDSREMLSEERIELGVVRRAVFRAIPPAPIAPLRRQQGFKCRLKCGFGWGVGAALCFCIHSSRVSLASIPQQFPRGDVFGVADPHVEICVDPGTGENSDVCRNVSSCSDGFACGQCAEVRIVFDAFVELTEEFAAVAV